MTEPTEPTEPTDTAPVTPTPGTTPIVVPPGTAVGGRVNAIRVRRRTPEIAAVQYDGTNAVQVAAWLISQGRPCSVDFQPFGPPKLKDANGAEMPHGWVLPNLEIIQEAELGTTYEQVPEVVATPAQG